MQLRTALFALALAFGLAWFVFQLHPDSHPTIKLEPNRQSMAFCSRHIPVGVFQWLTGDQRQRRIPLQKYLLGTYAKSSRAPASPSPWDPAPAAQDSRPKTKSALSNWDDCPWCSNLWCWFWCLWSPEASPTTQEFGRSPHLTAQSSAAKRGHDRRFALCPFGALMSPLVPSFGSSN